MNSLNSNWFNMFRMVFLIILFKFSISIAQPDTVWTRTFGGRHSDGFTELIQTEHSYVICGVYDYYQEGRTDFYIVKTDENGEELWSNTFGGDRYESCSDIQPLANGDFILAGRTNSFGEGSDDGYIIIVDSTGEERLSRTYGTDSAEYLNSIALINDSCIVYGGTAYDGENGSEFWLLKTDNEHEVIWQHTYGTPNIESASSTIQCSDSGFLMVGRTGISYTRGIDFFVVKTDSDGEEVWRETYGTDSSDACAEVLELEDGGFLLAGSTGFGPGGIYDSNFYLVRIDSEGEEIWSREYEGRGKDTCIEIIEAQGGGYVLAGTGGAGYDDFYLIRVDTEGEVIWSTSFGGEWYDVCGDIIQLADGSFVLVGSLNVSAGRSNDAWLVKTEPDPAVVPQLLDLSLPQYFILHSPYPNPFNSLTIIRFDLPRTSHVSITFTDLTGRRIATLLNDRLTAGNHHLIWDAKDCPAGVYLCRMEANGFRKVRKMVLVR